MPSLIRGRQTAMLALATAALGGSVLAGCTAPAGGTPSPSTTRPAPVPGAGSGQPGACAPVEVIAARGTTEPQSGSFIMGGLSNGIASATGGRVYQVQYPAAADFANGPNQGAADALAHLQAQAKACPDEKFVLNGYSQGAMVMVTLMQRLPADLQPRVVAAVLYGDPYYKSASPSAAGTAKGAANGIVPGLGVPAAFAGRTIDFCNTGDPVCGAGSNISAHLGYGVNQAEGIAFAVKRVQQS
jgi:cutinase